jgi:hypothetical protein
LTTGLSGIFEPANLFWDPRKHTVSKKEEIFWKDALRLGWDLLKAGWRHDSGWSADAFRQAFGKLRGQIKQRLFYPEDFAEIPESVSDDKAVHDILLTIMEKWRGAVEARPQEVEKTDVWPSTDREPLDRTAMVADVERPTEETAIIVPDESGEGVSAPEEVGEAWEETVVLPPTEGEGLDQAAPSPEEETEMRETVILAPEEWEREIPPPDQSSVESDLPETVIISPAKKSVAPPEPSSPLEAEEAGLEKGAALPGRAPEQEPEDTLDLEKSEEEEAEEDDFLAETVILRPKEGREKK